MSDSEESSMSDVASNDGSELSWPKMPEISLLDCQQIEEILDMEPMYTHISELNDGAIENEEKVARSSIVHSSLSFDQSAHVHGNSYFVSQLNLNLAPGVFKNSRMVETTNVSPQPPKTASGDFQMSSVRRVYAPESSLSVSQTNHCSIPAHPNDSLNPELLLNLPTVITTVQETDSHKDSYKHELDELKELRKVLEDFRRGGRFMSRVTTVMDKSTQTVYDCNKIWVSDCCVDTKDLPQEVKGTLGVEDPVTPSASPEPNTSVNCNSSQLEIATTQPMAEVRAHSSLNNNIKCNQALAEEKISVNGSLFQGSSYSFMNWFSQNAHPMPPATSFSSMLRPAAFPWANSSGTNQSLSPHTGQMDAASAAKPTNTIVNDSSGESSSYWKDPQEDEDGWQSKSESRSQASLDVNLKRLCNSLMKKQSASKEDDLQDNASATNSVSSASIYTDKAASYGGSSSYRAAKKQSDMNAVLAGYKYRKSITLLPNDPIILSYLNTSDRRLRSAATKNDVIIHIDGPITVCNPTLKCQALRNHVVYQLNIASNNALKVDKCIHYLRGTFEGSVVK